MKKIKTVICLLVSFIPQISKSQDIDFGLWYTINTQASLTKRLDFSLTGQIRTIDNASRVDQAYLETGVTYKFNKYLAVAELYRLGEYLDVNYGYHPRHNFLTDIKNAVIVGKIAFSSRLRLQIQKKTFIQKESDKAPDYTGRIRLKAQYKISKIPVNPYVAYENFIKQSGSNHLMVDKDRLIGGIEYKISKKHLVALEYIRERDASPHLYDINYISLAYTFMR